MTRPKRRPLANGRSPVPVAPAQSCARRADDRPQAAPDLPQRPDSGLRRSVPPGAAASVLAGPADPFQGAARQGSFPNCVIPAVCPLTWVQPQDIVMVRKATHLRAAPDNGQAPKDRPRRQCDCPVT